MKAKLALLLLTAAQTLVSFTRPNVMQIGLLEAVGSGAIGLQNGVLKYDPELVLTLSEDQLVDTLHLAALQHYLNSITFCNYLPESSLQ